MLYKLQRPAVSCPPGSYWAFFLYSCELFLKSESVMDKHIVGFGIFMVPVDSKKNIE